MLPFVFAFATIVHATNGEKEYYSFKVIVFLLVLPFLFALKMLRKRTLLNQRGSGTTFVLSLAGILAFSKSICHL